MPVKFAQEEETVMIVPLPKPAKRHIGGENEQHVVLENVRWQTYDMLCQDLDGQRVRMNFDRGRLEFMTISRLHELYKKLLARLIETMLDEEGRPCSFGGSMTFRREDLERGLEPDECYWVQNAHKLAGVTEPDFTRHPPPDLAVEVELSPPEVSRVGIFAALGVPEVWRFDGDTLFIGCLQADKTYAWGDITPTFPSLKPMDLVPFLHQASNPDHLAIVRAFRTWFRGQLAKPPQ
jgi:Uma2 family endonuclease